MFKWIVVIVALLSGVGTVPCLLYLIFMGMLEASDKEKEAKWKQMDKELNK
jgi:hypothetical protein